MLSQKVRYVSRHCRSWLAPTVWTRHKRLLSAAAQTVLDTRKEVKVLDSHMSYLDTGIGGNNGEETVVFLHGNPTAAYLWREVIPYVKPIARCVAPDLIGMGRSGKLTHSMYSFLDHSRYLEAWMDAVQLPEKVTIVGHDWGTALGLHWCNLNRSRAKTVVFMEGFVHSFPDWDCLDEAAQKFLKSLRSESGNFMVLEKNFVVERMLPYQVMHSLTQDEMTEYRRPYVDKGESRRPTLTWLQEIPFPDGKPDVMKIIDDYSDWLSNNKDLPKLYIHTEPGFFSPAMHKLVRSWPNLQISYVKGFHYVQEDSPRDIGQAIADFLQDVYDRD